MPIVVPVRFRYASIDLWFDPFGIPVHRGDHVITETERGQEIGLVVDEPFNVNEEDLKSPLKRVLSIATEEDLALMDSLSTQAEEYFQHFKAKVSELDIDMKPVACEILYDGSKIVCYFTADERIDFRELVRELAAIYHLRVDMRQIGVREEARIMGGYGHCGQQLCCARFGRESEPVSIRMAKEQDLPLNPSKISGACGRLMCCLRYEYVAYKDYKQRAPKFGSLLETPFGTAKIIELNTPKEEVALRLENGKSLRVPLSSLCCKGAHKGAGVSADVGAAGCGGAAGNGAAIGNGAAGVNAADRPDGSSAEGNHGCGCGNCCHTRPNCVTLEALQALADPKIDLIISEELGSSLVNSEYDNLSERLSESDKLFDTVSSATLSSRKLRGSEKRQPRGSERGTQRETQDKDVTRRPGMPQRRSAQSLSRREALQERAEAARGNDRRKSRRSESAQPARNKKVAAKARPGRHQDPSFSRSQQSAAGLGSAEVRVDFEPRATRRRSAAPKAKDAKALKTKGVSAAGRAGVAGVDSGVDAENRGVRRRRRGKA